MKKQLSIWLTAGLLAAGAAFQKSEIETIDSIEAYPDWTEASHNKNVAPDSARFFRGASLTRWKLR
jgi:hypothetical protein